MQPASFKARPGNDFALQVGVYESVTRAEVIALRADLPPGNQGAKVSDQLVTDVSQQMHEKLEQQRKQRLKEIEAEKKRVAEMRAKNPDYDSAAAPGDPQAKVTLKRAITTGWPTKSWEIAFLGGFERVSGGGQSSSGTSFLALRFFPGDKAAVRLGVFGGASLIPGPKTSDWGGVPPAAGVSFLIVRNLALEVTVDAAYYSSVSRMGYGVGYGITIPF